MTLPFTNCTVQVRRPPSGVDPMSEPTFSTVWTGAGCLTSPRGDGTMAGQRVDAVLVLPAAAVVAYGDQIAEVSPGDPVERTWSVKALVSYRGTPIDHHEVGVVRIEGVA